MYIQCIMCIDNCKYVLNSSLCGLSSEFMYVYIAHCHMYCTGEKLFLHCLERALKNFTHQGTCAVVIKVI